MVKSGDVIAVWVSCGAASAVAAEETIKDYPQAKVRLINNPVAEEHHDNRRFLGDLEKYLGIEIEICVNKNYPAASAVEVWDKRKAMSFPNGGAPCTDNLKKFARQQWENENHHDYIVLGFTADEKERSRRFALTERSNLLPILIDKRITKADCFRRIESAGIELPEIYKLGYPNANCIGCVKATSPTYWNHVRRVHPDIFAARAEQSRRLGAKLVRVQGERIFLDELNPLALGRPMKSLPSTECGIFCEEPAQ